MTDVTINETPLSRARRHPLRWVLIALAIVVVTLAAAHFFVMPRLVRSRVNAALRIAGLDDATFTVSRATPWGSQLRDVKVASGDSAARVDINYSANDLWNGRLDLLRIVGLRYAIPSSQAAATTRQSGSHTSQVDIPIRRVELVESKLLIGGEELPIDATIEKQAARFRVKAKVTVGGGVTLEGDIAQTFQDGKVSARASSVEGNLINPLFAALLPGSGVALQGTVYGEAEAKWAKEGRIGSAHLEFIDTGGEKASGSKLSIGPGVFDVVATQSPTTRPTLELRAKDASVATSNLLVSGVTQSLRLVDLSPPASARHQPLMAKLMKIGNAQFTNGQVQFELRPSGELFIEQTKWNWLGGEVSASDVLIPRDGPIKLTLHARNVELKQLLQLLAKDKASGEGKLTGDIPVTIDGSNIEFGDARITAIQGGSLQIKDAAAIVPTAEAAAQAAKTPSQAEEIKRNILEALKDFQFERMSAELKNEPDGSLGAFIRVSGRGRSGARQGVDYLLRVHRVDLALKSYLNIQAAIDKMRPPPATGKASP
jgi:hypothetical protein